MSPPAAVPEEDRRDRPMRVPGDADRVPVCNGEDHTPGAGERLHPVLRGFGERFEWIAVDAVGPDSGSAACGSWLKYTTG